MVLLNSSHFYDTNKPHHCLPKTDFSRGNNSCLENVLFCISDRTGAVDVMHFSIFILTLVDRCCQCDRVTTVQDAVMKLHRCVVQMKMKANWELGCGSSKVARNRELKATCSTLFSPADSTPSV